MRLSFLGRNSTGGKGLSWSPATEPRRTLAGPGKSGGLRQRIQHAPVAWQVALTGALIFVCGFADFLWTEGGSLGLSYLVPVGMATWLLSLRAGFIAALLVTVIAWAVDRAADPSLANSLGPLGHALVRFAFIALGVLVLSRLKNSRRRLVRAVAERGEALRAEASRRGLLEREIVGRTAREQDHLAQQIHDEMGQYLSALSYHAKVLAEDLQQESSPSLPRADRIVDLLRTTNQAIRRLARAIEVPGNGVDSLATALRELAEDFERLTGVTCHFLALGEPVGLERFHSLMIFRIVQEACSNAVKHGNPKNLTICLTTHGPTLHVSIEDDGCGFADRDALEGLGLEMMRHRAELIGAQLELRSGAAGCTLECVVSLPESASELSCA
jgi:signal transduction histidine kinase